MPLRPPLNMGNFTAKQEGKLQRLIHRDLEGAREQVGWFDGYGMAATGQILGVGQTLPNGQVLDEGEITYEHKLRDADSGNAEKGEVASTLARAGRLLQIGMAAEEIEEERLAVEEALALRRSVLHPLSTELHDATRACLQTALAGVRGFPRVG